MVPYWGVRMLNLSRVVVSVNADSLGKWTVSIVRHRGHWTHRTHRRNVQHSTLYSLSKALASMARKGHARCTPATRGYVWEWDA